MKFWSSGGGVWMLMLEFWIGVRLWKCALVKMGVGCQIYDCGSSLHVCCGVVCFLDVSAPFAYA